MSQTLTQCKQIYMESLSVIKISSIPMIFGLAHLHSMAVLPTALWPPTTAVGQSTGANAPRPALTSMAHGRGRHT